MFRIILVIILFTSTSIRADDSSDRSQQNAKVDEGNSRDGGHLELGAGLVGLSSPFPFDESLDSGVTLFLDARYQKYGFFIELPHGSSMFQSTIISFGYNFLNTENWAFDIQHAMNHRDVEYVYTEQGRQVIDQRDSHSEPGLRVSGYFEDTDMQFVVARASSFYGGGLYASAWSTNHYQYKNWNYYFSLGVQYRNEEVVNYFYGVNSYQTNAELPVYRGKSGLEWTAQIGVDYPITKHWVFESYLRNTVLPEGISHSPLVDDDRITEAAMVIKYVF